jgi:serine/threonine protein kinase
VNSSRSRATALAVGTRLGRYEIVAPLGAGGMGEVYRARDTRLPREVAVKTLRLGAQGSQERRKRFEREASIAARLNHPNICRLYDFGREGDVDFLVMEYLEGETLRDRLRLGPIRLDHAVPLALQIACALEEAHRHGVIHRDLKPGNVMITDRGLKEEVRLLDFGIAKCLADHGPEVLGFKRDESLTREGQVVGTTPYMSPEQLEGRSVDGRSDIFSFGAVIYEMLAGRPAFAASSTAGLVARILEHHPQRLSLGGAPGTSALVDLISRCLAKEPEARWQSASSVLDELERCRSEITSSDPSLSSRETTLWKEAQDRVERPTLDAETIASQAANGALPQPESPITVATQTSSTDPPSHAPIEPKLRTASNTGILLAGVGAAVLALYLNNPSVRDALLYPLLAVIGAVPITLLVSAFGGRDLRTAAYHILRTLGSLGGIAPQSANPGRRQVLGLALYLFLGSVISFLLGHAADTVMPQLTFLPHTDLEVTAWALTDPNHDWKTYSMHYKTAFVAHTGATEAIWQAHKHSFGRGSIRAARTLFCFGALLATAGAVDLGRRRWGRGVTSLIAGACACLILYSVWYDREGHYVREMVAASTRLPVELRPTLPESAPRALKRLVREGGP